MKANLTWVAEKLENAINLPCHLVGEAREVGNIEYVRYITNINRIKRSLKAIVDFVLSDMFGNMIRSVVPSNRSLI